MHEIHGPALVDGFRYRQRLRLLPHDPLPGFDPEVQLQFAVNAIHPFVVPWISLHVAQIQKAQPEPPVALVVGQANQVIGDLGILCRELCPVAVAGLADTECLAGQPDAGAVLFHSLLCHLAPARWLHHFFCRASWTISALRRSSAYIFLSRRFSSSSALSRDIREASMPPNLLRHL